MHREDEERVSLHSSEMQANAVRIADVFRFPKLKLKRHSASRWFAALFSTSSANTTGLKVPHLNEENPLSLFYHAGKALFLVTWRNAALMDVAIEHYAATSVKALRRVQDETSALHHAQLEKVHRAQRLLLRTLYLMVSTSTHPATGAQIDMERGRTHQARLPPEDRHEVSHTYSENIFYAAQALVGGYRVRGIEAWTAELRIPAQQLCATFDALRIQCKQAAMQPTFVISSSLHTLFGDFDTAWCHFEEAICAAYFSASLLQSPAERARTDSEAFVLLLTETMTRALERKLFPIEDVIDFEPYLMFALPRLAVVTALLHRPGWSIFDEEAKATLWFGPDAMASLGLLRTSLARASGSAIDQLERRLTDQASTDTLEERGRTRTTSSEDNVPLAFVQQARTMGVTDQFKLISSIADELHSGQCATEMVQILRRTFDITISRQ